MPSNLDGLHRALSRAGWFIPPYTSLGFLYRIAEEIMQQGDGFSQDSLEVALTLLYGAEGVAAMVTERYAAAPVIQDYRVTIAEAAEAHFLGLDHVAVGGLVPVIEGAGERLAAARGLRERTPVNLFRALAKNCKAEVRAKGLGAVAEVECMLDSFVAFARDYLYKDDRCYPLADGTNRPGITHGRYADRDYGRPLNFYKTIAAVDFLTFVASLRANLSWFAPEPTEASRPLAAHYRELMRLRARRPPIPMASRPLR
jgi:hypothetical protein